MPGGCLSPARMRGCKPDQREHQQRDLWRTRAATCGSISAGKLDLVSGGTLKASTAGPGAGGSISVTAQTVAMSGKNSGMSVTTGAPNNAGDGGNIVVRTDVLEAHDEAAITASTGGSGNGGVIDVVARQVVLDHAQITSDTNSRDHLSVFQPVSNLEVTLNITQLQDSNLSVSLIGPDGTQIELIRDAGGGSAATSSTPRSRTTRRFRSRTGEGRGAFYGAVSTRHAALGVQSASLSRRLGAADPRPDRNRGTRH